MESMAMDSPGLLIWTSSKIYPASLRETIPGFLEPLLVEGDNPCQLLEELAAGGGGWEDWYQKYYAQVVSIEWLKDQAWSALTDDND